VDEQPASKKHPLIVMAELGKRVVAGVLLILMFVVLSIAVLEMIWVPLAIVIPWIPGGKDSLIMTEAEMLATFGLFLSVLIALELVETVEVYFKDHEVHAEIVILVAMIAVARKVVLLDLHAYEPLTIVGIATLLVGLAATYVAIKWAKRLGPETSSEE
jgi:uncharacterized membrane protein (DUF373 family)